MDLKTQLLEWIRVEEALRRGSGKVPIVAVHYLLVQTAVHRQQDAVDSTNSIELSMQVFERASVGRILRELYRDQVIQIVNEMGEAITVDEKELTAFSNGDRSSVRFVALRTVAGAEPR